MDLQLQYLRECIFRPTSQILIFFDFFGPVIVTSSSKYHHFVLVWYLINLWKLPFGTTGGGINVYPLKYQRLEPKSHPIEKENNLANNSLLCSTFIFRGEKDVFSTASKRVVTGNCKLHPESRLNNVKPMGGAVYQLDSATKLSGKDLQQHQWVLLLMEEYG